MSEYNRFRVVERLRPLPWHSLWEVRFKDCKIWVMETEEDARNLCESLEEALGSELIDERV